ncbi:MAG: biotin synthase BioB [Kiritimatiellae bacterium]|nr:biotin synthase BioB [Kiritimatiellia bacterium]
MPLPPLAPLSSLLRSFGSVAIAYSGGTDSTFLLKVAHDVLGEKCVAFMVVSPFLPRRDLASARAWCQAEGIRLVELAANPTTDPQVAVNPPDRCYFCKKNDFSLILEAARKESLAVVCDGTNLDDLADYRPGAQAVAELGVRSPLRECGLAKAAIRDLSRQLGLPTWNQPAAACLASRIPYGETITPEKLRLVDAAEDILQAAGFRQVRVRLHGGKLARIEVPPADMSRLLARREDLLAQLSALGLPYVSLDLEGYRMGSLNEALLSPAAAAERILGGGALTPAEALHLLRHAPRPDLYEAAHRVTVALASRHFDFCAIVNARCGQCAEDCKWCAQSARWHTGVETFGWIGTEACVQAARKAEATGAERIGIVTSGRAQTPRQLDELCDALREMKKRTRIHLCGSLGLLQEDELRRLREAGLESLHCNLETAPSHFRDLCTTHLLADKLATLRAARRVGLDICCGGIIGMGETDAQLVEFAFALAELQPRSIPVNILRPIPGTPLGNSPVLAEARILDAIALLRLVNPHAALRFAGGRTQLSDDAARRAVYIGINAGISGPMLTTPGPAYDDDRALAQEAGYEVCQHLRPE